MSLRLRLFPLFLLLLGTAAAQPTEATLGAAPAWVEPMEPPALRPDEPAGDGFTYLLIDEQVRVTDRAQSHYVHVALGVVNERGIATASQLTVDYDPAYQHLTLHHVRVRRGAQVSEQLEEERVEILRREPGLEAQLYDGSATANLRLDDVRVGDVVEYAYTIDGANPVLDGRYYGGFDLGWYVPTRRVRYRLLWPQARPLFVRAHNTDVEPTRTRRRGVTEYRWAADDVAPLSFDDGLPAWYNPYPWVQLSEAATWAEVATWGERLFQRSGTLPQALRPVVAAIADSAAASADRVVAALRFAQDEVRYTGLEMGVGSHRPRPPAEVMRTRFGDCKDKALLLATMLEALDVEADVALVSVGLRRGIDAWHPSPYAFDHAIVRATVDGAAYWLDPTALHQRGRLDALTQADFDRALLLRPDTEGLVPMDPPRPSVPDRRVSEVLNLRDGVGESGTLAVTTTYVGDAADEMRARLAATPLDELADDYVNFYSALFPDIELAEPLAVDDDHDLNWVIVDERYTIAEPWQNSDGLLTLDLFAKETALLLDPPFTRRRTMPLGLQHPYHYQHRIEVLLPEPWQVEPTHDVIENDAFAFTFDAGLDGHVLTLDYEYRTKEDHVPAEATAAYLDDLDEARLLTGYQLYKPAGAVGGGAVNWPILLLGLGMLALAVVAARRVYAWEPAGAPIDLALTDQSLRGIRGWLLLVAFQLLVQPLVLLVQIQTLLPVFEASTWSALTQPGHPAYHSLFAPLALFELGVNLCWLVFALMLPVLFFQRRRSFPRVYIVYLVVAFAAVVLDALGTAVIPTIPTSADGIKEVIQRGTAALVWSLYFVQSDRVEATFVEPRRPGRSAPALGEAVAPAPAPAVRP